MIVIFSSVVSLFNYYEYSDGTAIWYPHILSGVHLETDKAQIIKKYGENSTDNAILHIPITETGGQRLIYDSDKNMLPWLPQKKWKALVNDDLPNYITFGSDDFFMVGEWDGDNPVNDADYADRLSEGFYAYMNRAKDYVYKITSVNGPYNVIPHFEITGK